MATSDPAAELRQLVQAYDEARDALTQAKKSTPQLADAVQAHGLALYGWMKDNRATILEALEKTA